MSHCPRRRGRNGIARERGGRRDEQHERPRDERDEERLLEPADRPHTANEPRERHRERAPAAAGSVSPARRGRWSQTIAAIAAPHAEHAEHARRRDERHAEEAERRGADHPEQVRVALDALAVVPREPLAVEPALGVAQRDQRIVGDERPVPARRAATSTITAASTIPTPSRIATALPCACSGALNAAPRAGGGRSGPRVHRDDRRQPLAAEQVAPR